MTKPRVVGMLVNHQEIDHLLTQMSDVLRSKAYNKANICYPYGNKERHQYFDDEGTLIGYDVDSNKALLRDCLDHYVQYSRDVSGGERLDFANYVQENFHFVADDILNDGPTLSFMTASFARACGILSSVLNPALEDVAHHGQIVDRIESFATSFENTFYLVVGEDVDSPEQYDPTEDDLSTVDCSQTPEELEAIAVRERKRNVFNAIPRITFNGIKDTSIKVETRVDPNDPHALIFDIETPPGIFDQPQHHGVSLAWNPEA